MIRAGRRMVVGGRQSAAENDKNARAPGLGASLDARALAPEFLYTVPPPVEFLHIVHYISSYSPIHKQAIYRRRRCPQHCKCALAADNPIKCAT